MTKSKSGVVTNHRNAINGQFVKAGYVKTHKATTTTEHNPRRSPSPKKTSR